MTRPVPVYSSRAELVVERELRASLGHDRDQARSVKCCEPVVNGATARADSAVGLLAT
jgi:hypothetical protein